MESLRKDGAALSVRPCEVCGEGKTQAHHDSYLEKDLLNVRFLCIRHHKEWHRFNKPIYPQIGEQSKITEDV